MMYLRVNMVKGLSVMMCQVASVERAADFYKEVLGLIPGYVSPHWADFSLPDGTKIGLHSPFTEAAIANGSGWILGIEVEDVAQLRSKLVEAGHHAGAYHDIPGGVVIDFTDLDGNPIQAMQSAVTVKDLAEA
jgi:catechol 2,3-dioxygenase-like lactoylglutathione lyase family enzyme